MRYSKKLPETDKALSKELIEDGWIKIKEPKSLISATMLSLPFAFLLTGITLGLAYLLKPEILNFFAGNGLSIMFKIDIRLIIFIVSIFIYIFIHEMIHAVFVPNFLSSDKTYWGMNGLFGFVATTEEISKQRYLIITIMPFVILSLVMLIVFYLIGMLNWFTLGLCIINAASSCVDFLNLLLIIFQVKSGSKIINNGFETYYKSI